MSQKNIHLKTLTKPLRITKGIGLLSLLLAHFIPTMAMAAPLASARDIYLKPLPASAISFQSTSPEKPGFSAEAANNARLDQTPMFSQLAGTSLVLDFPANTTLRGVAIPRVGWTNWAVPAKISLTADGVSLGEFSLNAPRHKPDNRKPSKRRPAPIVTSDVIDFGEARPIRQLQVTVKSVESTGNTHGTLKLCAYQLAPIHIDLKSVGGVPTDSTGVELVIQQNSPAPRSGTALTASIYQFRRITSMRAPLPALAPGENRIRVRWNEFSPDELPVIAPISPQHFHALLIGNADPEKNDASTALLSWSFLKNTPNDTTRAALTPPSPPPSWEQIAKRDFSADAEGWRPGIPSDGFGRFGWLQNNGLLVGSLAPDRFAATAIDGQGNKQTGDWRFHFGDAKVQSWTRTSADWVSVRHEARYDFSAEMRNELAAKAPELLKETRFPQAVTASILAPGFLLDSQDRSLVIESTAIGKTRQKHVSTSSPSSPPRILAPTRTGIRWLDTGSPLNGDDLSEGWIIVVWPDLDGIPLMLALQKKTALIRIQNTTIELRTENGPLGRIGVAFPSGYYLRGTEKLDHTGTDVTLAQRARQIAAILRAYPLSATQEFRTPSDAPGTIEIRETIQHLEWRNDWDEPARRVAPIPPLVRFAADNGYPVTLPQKLLPSFDWPTKTGPYTAVDGNTITWRLPVPEKGTRFYLRPAGPDKLADHVAAEIPASSRPRTSVRIDALAGWWMQAPGSLAFPLLDATQQKTFLEGYRERLEQSLQPTAWFLRKEPFSQAAYPVSFAWIESHTNTLGDLNSGLGAVLYGMWAYARCSGDWDFVAQKWPALRGAFEYYLVQHDWNNMQTGAREHSGSSAIDMDGIGYEGAVAFAAMSQELGYTDEAALGRLLTARLGLSTTMRWIGPAWTQPLRPRDQWDTVGVGFSEFSGFDTFHARHGGPDHAASEIALTLSWVGQYPELYDLHLRGLGRDFWQWFEQDFVGKKMVDWRKNHPGNRNNHPANITAHLYMRGLLGAPISELTDELAKQSEWGLEPRAAVAQENAALYALIAGRDFPVSLISWGRAAVKKAEFDKVAKQADLEFSSSVPALITFAVTTLPEIIRLNAKPVTATTITTASSGEEIRLQLSLPPGESRIEIIFP
ncbi:hypothetical protein Ga0100231_012855 [Opitutaceae bacterium TAV4]|nr:hypothetical protein Ga0100231_012855 [Opitutaceae bacterium TAV4]